MKKVETTSRTFETIEELRRAIIRRQFDNPKTVVFVGPKAVAEMAKKMKNAMVVGEGVWKDWPRVMAIRIDGGLRSFEKAADGERMFFYELDS